MPCLIQIDHESLPFSVIVEDDGKVAYAYLIEGQRIVSDVWLYNCGAAPTEPEWRDRSKAPFANASAYVAKLAVKPIADGTDVSVNWVRQEDNLDRAELYLRDELFAVLAPNVKPGWCRNALKDGPLAKVLA
jgi:hypothetical protein